MAPARKRNLPTRAANAVPINASPRRERLLLLLICLLAAVRAFVFSAAFPFFNNVDEQGHYDCVSRLSHGKLIVGLDVLTRESCIMFGAYQSLEYMLYPDDSSSDEYPPTWQATPEQIQERVSSAIRLRPLLTNIEGVQPPVYYAIAGAWLALGRALGFSLFWLRFLNVPVLVLTVLLAYMFARNLYPDRALLRLGLPMMVAVVPQDLYYSISNGTLFAFFYGAAFYCLVMIGLGKRDRIGFYALAGALCAAALLTGYTNISVFVLLAVVTIMRFVSARRTGTLRAEVPRLAVMLAVGIVPVAAWLVRNCILLGAPTASVQFTEFAGWTKKPFLEMWNHPIFTAEGIGIFWRELTTMYFRGEFVWYREPLRTAWADGFYVWSPVVLLAMTAIAMRTRKRTGNFVDGMGFLAFAASIALLVGLSIRYHFGDWWGPSNEHPYYSNGRLIYGTMLPFFALYLTGLDALLARLKLGRFGYPVLIAMCVLMWASEIAVSLPVFSSQFNWFHMITSEPFVLPD